MASADDVLDADWEDLYAVTLYPEGDRGSERTLLIPMDPTVVIQAHNGNEAMRRMVFMAVAAAFRRRPGRIRWNQLRLVNLDDYPREHD